MIRALADHLWQSTLFCAAIWSIALALRANSAAVRHRLWMLASVKFLVPFSVLYLFGAAAGLPPLVEPQPAFFEATIEAAAPVLSPVSLSEAAGRTPAYFVIALGSAWTLGVLWFGSAWLRGWSAARTLSRVARPAPGASPDVHVTDADVEPSVAGVLRPVVLLPASLLGRLTRAQFEAVLTHEREHIARHDNLLAHVHRLVETLFWFHPAVWFIGRRLLEERERACDEAVLAQGHDPADYAAGILTTCRYCAAAHCQHAAAALAGDLTTRVRHILGNPRPVALGSMPAMLLALCSLSVAAIPLAAGAMDGSLRRREALDSNARILVDGNVAVTATTADAGTGARISASGNEVSIGNTSLRELIAMAYGVRPYSIIGEAPWLDAPRYDIHISVDGAVADPEDFDARALRRSVNKLLAARFDLEIHVNQRCQDPCGRRALETSVAAR